MGSRPDDGPGDEALRADRPTAGPGSDDHTTSGPPTDGHLDGGHPSDGHLAGGHPSDGHLAGGHPVDRHEADGHLGREPVPDAVQPTDHAGAATGTAVLARPRRTTLLAIVALLVLALDVVTKVLVVAELEGQRTLELLGGQLLVRVSRNSGAAFSLAQGATLLLTAVAVAVVVVILRVSRRLGSRSWALSLGLLLGGATGNLVDRLLRSPGPGRGAVVDFIDFQVWPSFNVADSAIVTGGLLAVLLSFRGIEIDGSRARDAGDG